MAIQDWMRLASLFGGNNQPAGNPMIMDDPARGGITGNLGRNKNIWGNILGATNDLLQSQSPASTQSPTQQVGNPFRSGMSPQEFDQAFNSYAASKGIQPTDSSRQTWKNYYGQWGSNDPEYLLRKMNDAPEFGGTGSTYAHAGATRSNAAMQDNQDFVNSVPQYETPAFDAYRQNVTNYPNMGNPGVLRTIGTGLLSGLQGTGIDAPPVERYARDQYGVTRRVLHHPGFWESFGRQPFNVQQAGQILNMPQNQAEADWKAKNDALYKAAQMETQLPLRASTAKLKEAQAAVIPQREARVGAENAAKIGQGQQRIDINQAKLELAKWKAENPQGKIYAPKGGNVTLINPLTGEATDTGIATGMLSDADRIALTGEQRLTQIGAQGAEQRKTQELKGAQEMQQIGARGAEARSTKTTVPGKAAGVNSGKELSPTQQIAAQKLRAAKAVQENPDWGKYIQQDPNTGMITIKPPSSGRFFSSGPTPEMYQQMVDYMNQATPATTNTAPKPTPPGQVKVKDKDGTEYFIPANQLRDAIAQGYTQVK